MNKEELWQAALADIEVSISKANFLTWFKSTSVVSKKDGVVTLGVPNTFTKEWLENKYNRLILRSLRNLVGEIKEIRFAIHSQTQEKDIKGSKKKAVEVVVLESQLNFPEVETDSETNLNPRYTFDSFVVASSNELAHAASLAVSEDLGMTYNPLFLYGGVGLGKTHLLQAIGNEVVKKFGKTKKIKYVSSERFTHEVVTAIKTGSMEKFKGTYQRVDLLILDDVQFLSGKEKTQEEFFHTFNALYEKNKQIVLSSDRPPKAIPTLEERLRSRFEGGMIADISQPDYETRLAILKTKSAEKKFGIEEDILNILAEKITSNVRELEGALNRVVATARLTGNPPSADKIKELLDSNQRQNKNKITPKTIIRIVSEFYDVKEEDLINKSRKREIVFPRQICMYLIRGELKNSYPFIGEKFGGRDHTTVMHACDKISKGIESSEVLSEEINLIKSRLYN
jgi:chromosomal replication initiator protein